MTSKKLMVTQLTAAFQAGAVVKVIAFGTSAKAGMNRLASVVAARMTTASVRFGMALPKARAAGLMDMALRLPPGDRLAQPVERDRQRHDRKARLHRLADLQRASASSTS